MQKRFGAKGLAKLQAWEALLENNKTKSIAEKNKAVNDFFNKNTHFEDDIIHWKISDYWATPLETLGSEAGDCEDYTIAKYFSLVQLGIPVEKLRLIYVKAQIGGPSAKYFRRTWCLVIMSNPIQFHLF